MNSLIFHCTVAFAHFDDDLNAYRIVPALLTIEADVEEAPGYSMAYFDDAQGILSIYVGFHLDGAVLHRMDAQPDRVIPCYQIIGSLELMNVAQHLFNAFSSRLLQSDLGVRLDALKLTDVTHGCSSVYGA